MGNESTIIHTDDTREVVISRGEQLITLKPIGKAHMSNWSVGKKELFRKHQCKVGDGLVMISVNFTICSFYLQIFAEYFCNGKGS